MNTKVEKSSEFDLAARKGAVKQWTENPCGAVNSIDNEGGRIHYFKSVEEERYRVQDWMLDYFDFDSYSGKNVLEIGVGQGTDMLQFAKAGANCFGADITKNHIDIAKEHLALYGYRYQIELCDATDLQYKDDTFDCVYSFGVLHHIPEVERVVKEVSRVLSPGGKIQMAFYYRFSVFHLFYKLLGQGICEGKLFSLGYRGLMSTVEKGADGKNIKPYVTTYSRNRVKRLFGDDFRVNDISVFQLYPDHFYSGKLGRGIMRLFPFIRKYFGWYVTIKAVKE